MKTVLFWIGMILSLSPIAVFFLDLFSLIELNPDLINDNRENVYAPLVLIAVVGAGIMEYVLNIKKDKKSTELINDKNEKT